MYRATELPMSLLTKAFLYIQIFGQLKQQHYQLQPLLSFLEHQVQLISIAFEEKVPSLITFLTSYPQAPSSYLLLLC
jgi:hypothetical protein